MRRTLVCILILLVAIAAQAKTRMIIHGGVDATSGFAENNYSDADVPAIHLAVAAEVQRKTIPLEVLAGFDGWYERYNGREDEYNPYFENRWARMSSTFEAVRAYGKAGAMETGLGLSLHQFWKYGRAYYRQKEKYVGMSNLLRAQGFLRIFFYPSERFGPLFEFEVQEALFNRMSTDLPIYAVLVKLGWYFKV